MIPQRVCLQGFLSYRDEQVVMLDSSSLWMMAGLNGSGKSAIFDAITFALFGHHRGGSQQAGELINHDSDRAIVEFDFLLDGQAYQARRTVSRKSGGGSTGTQQLYQITSDGNKEAVPGTSRKIEFNQWVSENIGLNYETFTSSVLLLQGRAEKLLDSTPSGRFSVLAGIVNLEKYQQLYDKADGQRKLLRASIQALEHQLEGTPEIGELEIENVKVQITEAEEKLTEAQQKFDTLKDLERQAKYWKEVIDKQSAITKRWNDSQELLTEAEEIEQALARLRELELILGPMQSTLDKKTKIRQSQKEEQKLANEEKQLHDAIRVQDELITQQETTLAELQKSLTESETNKDKANQQFQELATVMSKVELYEKTKNTLEQQQKQLQSLSYDPKKVDELTIQLEELTTLSRRFPVLQRFAQHREHLRQAISDEKEFTQKEKEVREQGGVIRQQHDELTKKYESLTKSRQELENTVAVKRSQLERATEELQSFSELDGAKMCRQCGQPLTPGHFQDELARRTEESTKAEQEYHKIDEQYKDIVKEETKIQVQLEKSNTELQNAREEFVKISGEVKAIQQTVERWAEDCAQTANELGSDFQQQLGVNLDNGSLFEDQTIWVNTTYPDATELKTLQQRIQLKQTVQQQLNDAQTQIKDWQTLKTKCEATQESLTEMKAELPGEVEAIRREHIRLNAEIKSLVSQAQNHRAEEKKVQQELTEYRKERTKVDQRLSTVRANREKESARQQDWQKDIESTRKSLPESWQTELDQVDMGLLHEWSSEKKQLEENDIPAKAKQLESARRELETLKQQREEIEQELTTFPKECQVEIEVIEKQLGESKTIQEQYNKELRDAQTKKTLLEKQREQRQQIEKQLLEQQHDFNRYNILAQLLGRDRLQRHLVRRAERQVVELANAVLDRLSGGQLYLKLRGDDTETLTEKALELEAYNRNTTAAPINVSFLSGSQRFRVAVSLALALGQYASRQYRPIESVIIDEGFGCLDRQGRQVMIQELQNLRGQLRCILLVSHQEEFADAFADGYRFELEDGATRVKRFEQ